MKININKINNKEKYFILDINKKYNNIYNIIEDIYFNKSELFNKLKIDLYLDILFHIYNENYLIYKNKNKLNKNINNLIEGYINNYNIKLNNKEINNLRIYIKILYKLRIIKYYKLKELYFLNYIIK